MALRSASDHLRRSLPLASARLGVRSRPHQSLGSPALAATFSAAAHPCLVAAAASAGAAQDSGISISAPGFVAFSAAASASARAVSVRGGCFQRARASLARNGPGSGTVLAAMSTSVGKGGDGSSSSSPTGAIVVYVTVPSAEVGETLGSKLVESKLAACVNMLPGVTSIYSWKGKIEKDPELLLIIKTREALLPELIAFVRSNHPYDEPEVIGLPVLGGSPSYLQWLMDNTDKEKA